MKRHKYKTKQVGKLQIATHLILKVNPAKSAKTHELLIFKKHAKRGTDDTCTVSFSVLVEPCPCLTP